MLTATRLGDSRKVLARDSEKRDGPFGCPECGQEVVLHKGMVVVYHFAHKPPVTCQYGTGESEAHRRCKQALYDSLGEYPDVERHLERFLGEVRPDVLFTLDGNRVAIEVQISSLTMRQIIERTAAYNRLGVYLLWLPVFDERLNGDLYSPRQWEKWLHATYLGRIYYWLERLTVAAVHLDDYEVYVPESSWRDARGYLQSGGGYSKRSKRYRIPNRGPDLGLLSNDR